MYLGIDLGTTNIKAVVTDGDGRVVAGGSSPVDIFHMAGRAACSKVTPRIVSDATGLPVTCIEEPDVSAVGAAIIARSLVERDIDLGEFTKQRVIK